MNHFLFFVFVFTTCPHTNLPLDSLLLKGRTEEHELIIPARPHTFNIAHCILHTIVYINNSLLHITIIFLNLLYFSSFESHIFLSIAFDTLLLTTFLSQVLIHFYKIYYAHFQLHVLRLCLLLLFFLLACFLLIGCHLQTDGLNNRWVALLHS